jgi:hypothetical protein
MSTARTLADSPLDLLFERYRTRLINRGRKSQTIYNFVRAAVPFQRRSDDCDRRCLQRPERRKRPRRL